MPPARLPARSGGRRRAFTVTEHRAICEAIRAGDPDGAENAMAEHIRSSFRRAASAFHGRPEVASLPHHGAHPSLDAALALDPQTG
nr:FCD domain-containing protein [Xylanimonas allomyrinae]